MRTENRIRGYLNRKKGLRFEKLCEQLLDRMGIPYLHLRTSIARTVKCPFCHRSFFRNFPVEGNKGFLDFLIFLPNSKICFIELKTGSSSLTKDQRDFMAFMGKLNIECLVVPRGDFDKFKQIVNQVILPKFPSIYTRSEVIQCLG